MSVARVLGANVDQCIMPIRVEGVEKKNSSNECTVVDPARLQIARRSPRNKLTLVLQTMGFCLYISSRQSGLFRASVDLTLLGVIL